jgi:AbrB family looped-hinge helix DNA binding protein
VATKTTVEGSAIVIPAELRDRYGLVDGSIVEVEADGDGILLRPLAEPDIEIYTPERKAEFFLNNVFDAADYAWAVDEVRKMGLDPDTIPHLRPDGTVR